MAAATVLGCASTPHSDDSQRAPRLANHDSPAVQGAEPCHDAFSTHVPDAGTTLDPRSIGVLVWNIQKGRDPSSLEDLGHLASGKDLVLIQEARLDQRPFDAFDDSFYWTFAPGYETASISTGVMTLSNAAPLTHCHLSNREPWMRSPKAISITRFRLDSTDATLAVVNVHAVNFTFGVGEFERQIAKIETALSGHDGPVLLAGDFNTWRTRRVELLQALAGRLGLDELSFENDDRRTAFGRFVDRIFVRGLRAVDAKTAVVDSSDHNPMSVTLSFQP